MRSEGIRRSIKMIPVDVITLKIAKSPGKRKTISLNKNIEFMLQLKNYTQNPILAKKLFLD